MTSTDEDRAQALVDEAIGLVGVLRVAAMVGERRTQTDPADLDRQLVEAVGRMTLVVHDRDDLHEYVASAEAMRHLVGDQPTYPDAGHLTVVIGGNPGNRDYNVSQSPYVARSHRAAVAAFGPTRVHYVNVGAFSQTESARLRPSDFDAGRDRNRRVVVEQLAAADQIIAAWGNPPLRWGREDVAWMREQLTGRGNVWRHPDLTAEGQPCHAQRWRTPQPLVRWSL